MAGREGKLNDLEAREEQKRLSKAELLRPRLVEEDVYINSLKGTIRISSISHATRQEIKALCGFGTAKWDEEKFELMGIVSSIIDPKLTVDDLEELAKQDSTVIDEIALAIATLNMLGRTEDLKKDSETTPSLDSVSS